MKCEHCGHDPGPTMSMEEYLRRAKPRMERIEQLNRKIDFGHMLWRSTPDGQTWKRLMDEQMQDEIAAGP